jgi:hypothetical protein
LVRCAKECNGRMARGKRSCCRERPVTARCIGRVGERRGGMGALSQGEDGMGWDGSKKTEGCGRGAGKICILFLSAGGRRSQTLLTLSLPLSAPNLRRRADAFRPLAKRARQQFAVAVGGLRQCAEALDGVSGVSTGKRYRRGETPLSAHYSCN